MDGGIAYWRMVGAVSLLATAALCVLIAEPAAAADEQYLTYSGTAAEPQSGRFLYGEVHLLHYRGGELAERVVLYTCPDGSTFARKIMAYTDPLAPDFALEDASLGLREGVRGEGLRRVVFYREDGSSRERSGAVPPVSGLVADAGFDEFVRTKWQALMRADRLDMPFLVPSRLEPMTFKVSHVGSDRVDGIPVEAFRLKLSGVLGLVGPSIDVFYGAQDHVLLRYVGPTDLRDASHKNFQADITFPPADRRPSTAKAMEHARSAPLAACR